MNNSQILNQVRLFAQQKMQSDQTGHGFDHILRVVKNASYILEHENQPADPTITLAAAYLHDIADDKLVADPQQSEQQLQQFLTKIGFSAEQGEQILLITHNISFSKSLEKSLSLPFSGQIVQDADRLDAIGAIGIVRAVYYGGAHQETIYDPMIAPRREFSKAAYRDLTQETIINHFHEKLLKLAKMMNTATAKRLARHRQQFMLDFLAEFQAEWQGRK
ncbi:HD domain-containing protein [Liquorilactobacillus vini]|uniref:HD superfamily hydrolase n=1 Tax=Liquorilactobacillus vini DSM 20605 TaxID=1133569 RepID=A0A0R2C9X2_9LACO|nr:HD domain-containing protein [Liquorilactobacillus vini]KRM88671.1 HD superfamily hydrolase [Liquorilactobacillus vini DSM 20605]